ncbi:PAS domain S-box protein [Kosakonia sacchari]|uniref:PAS domain-containing hybrid sensor histidine kinase/response regulator n=1 Tax=Kosakonia sacchari TaxID=1158459 RepID=UPI0025B206B3|nr:PAS domain S-box protein [Kosakonia sacchari]MDN2488208.1 PAS domain S-box protein [Kosakonia sacchari]
MKLSDNFGLIMMGLRTHYGTAMIFFGAMCCTVVAMFLANNLNERNIRQTVIKDANAQFDSVIERINRYRYGLYEARTAVLSSGGRSVTNEGITEFAQSLDLNKDFPGARGFGFIRKIKQQSLADYVEREKREGHLDFRISSIGRTQGDHYIIEYLVPSNVSTNASAIGLDIASEENRKNAADIAVLSGDISITAPLTLKYSSKQIRDAFLIFLPVYDGARTPVTPDERLARCFGWAFAPLNIHEVLDGSNSGDRQMILSIRDITDSKNIEEFYRSSTVSGLYPYSKDALIMGRTWRFTLAVTPDWVSSLNVVSVPVIGLLGLLISIILAMLVHSATLRRTDRKRLQIEQNRLTLIVESSADAIIGKDLIGNVISWNKGAERMFGYSREEAIGKTLRDLIIPERLQMQESDILRRVRNGETFERLETVRHRKDGTEIFVAASISPLYSANRQVIGVSKSVRDISLQKEAERRIRELNHDLEQQVRQRTEELASVNILLSTVLSATYEFMIIATDLNGTIRLFNQGAERMLGYHEDEVVGKTTPVIIHVMDEIEKRGEQLSKDYEENVSGFDVFIYQARKGYPEHHEWTYVHKDGSTFPVNLVVTAMYDSSGCITGYLGIAADITQQRKSQQALEAARDQLLSTTQTLLIASKTAGLGIWSWNIAADVLEWNDKMYELYDLPPETCQAGLTFQHWASRIHPDDIDIAVGELKKSIASRKEYMPVFRIIRSNGNQHFIQAGAYTEYDNSGHAVRVTGINLDITEDRTLKLSLIEAKEQADAANAAKSMFLANMSHEIRTPMNAVLGLLQLLLKTPLSSKQKDFAFKAHVAATSLLSLLNDVLDYSKIDAGKLELDLHPLDLHALMQQLAIILSGNLRSKSVELLFDLDHQLPTAIIGDALRLQQILINLVSNAIKFTEKGEIVVKTVLLGATEHTVNVRISVADTGIGISKAQQDNIFNVFTQAEASTSRRYGGSGLGLVISRRLVEQMGGALTVESTPGKGSTFSFDLLFERDISVDWNPLIISGPPPHILVVDDNAVSCELLADTLRNLNARVECTYSAAQAIQYITTAVETGNKFDILFLDWLMPETDGVTLANQIRHNMHLTPLPHIILITAAAHEELPDVGSESSFDKLMSKPVTPQQLIEVIASLNNKSAPSYLPETTEDKELDGLSLLVVEDNVFNQTVAAELLSSKGAKVTIASGGEEGVNTVLHSGNTFDVVLMDLQMPDIDGFEATRRIRAVPTYNTLPVVAMTANVGKVDIQHCFAVGMNAHISKPLVFDDVVATLLNVTGRKSKPFVISSFSDSLTENLLKRSGGNVRVYQKILRSFMPSFTKLITELRKAHIQQNRQEAMRLIHTLKGITGTAGLDNLYRYIVKSESELKTSDNDRYNLLLSDLLINVELMAQTEYQSVYNIISELATTSESLSEELRDIDLLIENLELSLASSNMKALDDAKNLYQLLNKHETQQTLAAELLLSVENLEFDKAAETLNFIKEYIHVEKNA